MKEESNSFVREDVVFFPEKVKQKFNVQIISECMLPMANFIANFTVNLFLLFSSIEKLSLIKLWILQKRA